MSWTARSGSTASRASATRASLRPSPFPRSRRARTASVCRSLPRWLRWRCRPCSPPCCSSPALLLFALMSPVLLIGQWWSDRRAGRVSYRRQVREHAALLAQARSALAEAVAADAAGLRADHPDLGHLEAVARRRGTRLWERRPSDDDHLVLRLGTATQPTRVDVSGPAPDGVPHVNGLPALLDVATSGVVGVAGPRAHTLSLVGGLLLQVATWHTPRTVQVHVLADTHEHALDWEWAAHLPHVRDDDGSPARVTGRAADVARHVSALRELVDSRRGADDGRWTGSTTSCSRRRRAPRRSQRAAVPSGGRRPAARRTHGRDRRRLRGHGRLRASGRDARHGGAGRRCTGGHGSCGGAHPHRGGPGPAVGRLARRRQPGLGAVRRRHTGVRIGSATP